MIMNERTEIAAMCLQGILSNPNVLPDGHQDYYVAHAVKFADALLAELANTKPKPTQRPWKVGDKVRITKEIHGHAFKDGKVVELRIFKGDSLGEAKWFAKDNKGIEWWISEEEAELVTE